MAPRDLECYRFGPYVAEVESRELRRGDTVILLTGKTFDLLVSLLRGAGRTVTKSELMAALWPDAVVEDSNLTQTVFLLRKALGEDANGAAYIQTVRGQGYRFIVPVNSDAAPRLDKAAAPPVHWRKHAAAIAGVAVLAAVAVFIWYRTRPAPMTDEDILVLADFSNSTGDAAFDGTLREALAFQLEQAPFLKVLDDRVMRQDLERMRLPAKERITNDLAHAICVREKEKAMLEGTIAKLGTSYLIELKTTDCETGGTLAREQTEAGDKEHVLEALAKAARGLRAKLGESLSSIEKLAPPVLGWEVTTGSLEAFKAFRAGAELYAQGRFSEAIPVLQRATELDPDLAFAWFWLASASRDSGAAKKVYQPYLDKAWALRDRVSAYERLWIISQREGQTTGQYIEDLEEWARTYPRNPMPHSFFGRIYQSAGEFESALPQFQESYRIYQRSYGPAAIEVIGLVMIYGQLDRFEEARAVAEKMLAQGGDSPVLHWQLLAMAYAQGNDAEAAKEIQWFAGKPEEYRSLGVQAGEARVRGQLRRSRVLLQQAADLARLRNLLDTANGFSSADAGADALIGKCETARRTGVVSDSTLDRIGLATVVPVNHTGDAVLALCGTPALAKQAEDLNRHWVSGIYNSPAQVPVTRAATALGLGKPDQAIELLESARPYERGYAMASYIRGLAYLRLKKGQKAAAEFQNILDHRGANWGPLYPLSYVGLARGAVLAGDTAQARAAYEKFFDLWKDADPDVPILIQARAEYAGLAKGLRQQRASNDEQ